MWTALGQRTVTYMENSSIHGLRYIIDKKAHWIEKIFWVVVCCSCVYGTYMLFVATWLAYIYNAVSFVTETTFLEWNTTFPAVSVCETESSDKVFAYGEMLFGEDRNMNLDSYLGEIVYFSGTCYACSSHCGKIIECPEDVFGLVNAVRYPCDQLLTHCSWNEKTFDCCKNFEPLETEFGVCYSINSRQTKPVVNATDKIELISNRLTGPGILKFRIHDKVKVLIHSQDDVPYINHATDEFEILEWGSTLNMSFQISEIVNDWMLEEVSVDRRNCRFPHENPLSRHRYYSYSACIVECHAQAQLRICGCVQHLMPYQRPGLNTTCDTAGLSCLTDNSVELRSLKTPWSNKPGLTCNCTSSCTEPEFRVLKKIVGEAEETAEGLLSTVVTMELESLPTDRFVRNVVRSKLDLVVSMGGTAGLFLGASLLSTFEIIYYCCLRQQQKAASQLQADQHNKSSQVRKDKASIFEDIKKPNLHNPVFYLKDFNRINTVSYHHI